MDERELKLLALGAGLDRALARFPDEVVEALRLVKQQRTALRRPLPRELEPWPPMSLPDD